jgi:hypothetical protein
MPDRERRKSEHELISALKRELNDDQRDTLAQLERFGWTLKFVRRPVFQDAVDGTLNEKAALLFRE